MFYLLTFAASWLLWMPLLVWLRREGRLGGTASDEPLAGMPWWVGLCWLVGSWAPSLVAIALTARSDDRSLGDLFGRLVDLGVGLDWNAIAFFGPMVLGLVAIAFHLAGGGAGIQVSVRRLPLAALALVAALPFGPLGEELGWRGYALPDLLANHGGLASALILGIVWTAWHLPLFWAPLGTTISGAPVTISAVGRYLLEITALSVVMTWAFFETAGSLWIAVWLHAAWNAAAHRFWFKPFSDDVARRVEIRTVTVLVALAVVLASWPGLAWGG